MATIEEQVMYEMALEEYERTVECWKPSHGPFPLKPRRPIGRPRFRDPDIRPKRPVGRPPLSAEEKTKRALMRRKQTKQKEMRFECTVKLDSEIIAALEDVRGSLSLEDALREALRSALSLPSKIL